MPYGWLGVIASLHFGLLYYLGEAATPLFDAGRLSGSSALTKFLFVGTMFATLASANGCINDASRAWARRSTRR